MKIKIEIECDTYMEAMQHLFVIRRDLKRKLKKDGVKTNDELMNNAAEKQFTIEDNNCYGTHILKVKP